MKKLVAAGIIWTLTTRAETKAPEIISDVLDERFFATSVKLEWVTDPFQKTPGFAAVEPERVEDLKLDAILFSARNPSAIVDGRTVTVGDDVGNFRVHSIGKNYVLLEQNDSLVELSMPPEPERTGVLEVKKHEN